MIEAYITYQAKCEECRTQFGRTHSTKMREMIPSRNFFTGAIIAGEYELNAIEYTGPHVCPACDEKQKEKGEAK